MILSSSSFLFSRQPSDWKSPMWLQITSEIQDFQELNQPKQQITKLRQRAEPLVGYLDDCLSEVRPSDQQALQVVPLLLQGSQVRLQLVLGALVSHWEELPADVQRVDEGGLVPLEQELRVLRDQRRRWWLSPPLLPFIHLKLISSFHQRVLTKSQEDNSRPAANTISWANLISNQPPSYRLLCVG